MQQVQHPKKFHCTKTAGKPCIDTTKQHPDIDEEFAKSLVDALTADKQRNFTSEKWDHLRETIQKTAFETFGRKTSKNCDWFEAKSNVMMPIIDEKRAALVQYKRSPNEKYLQALFKLPGAKCSRQQEDVPTNSGSSSATTSRLQLQQATLKGCPRESSVR